MANQTRARWRRQALDVRVSALPRGTEADGAVAVAVRVDLARVWQRLSAADREVLALTAFDGLDSTQAALVLGCRPSTYTTRLSRARRRLRDALDPLPEAQPHSLEKETR